VKMVGKVQIAPDLKSVQARNPNLFPKMR
jgi:hypothetical protein